MTEEIDKETKEYIIISNNEVLEEYCSYYFKKYPKRNKKPIDKPTHPSINIWMIQQRLAMNQLKQNWKDYTEWLVKKNGYENLKLEKFEITFEFYMPTKRRADNDNFSPKFVMDGLVTSGMIVDDDYEHCNPLHIVLGYKKNNPTMIIKIKTKDDKNN